MSRTGPMALPKPVADKVRAAQQKMVVPLREVEHRRWDEIASRMMLSKRQCQRRLRSAVEESRGLRDVERHRDRLFADIDLLLRQVTPFVTGEEMPPDNVRPDPEDLAMFLTLWKAEVSFLGAVAPKVTEKTVEVAGDIGVIHHDPAVLDFTRRVATLAVLDNVVTRKPGAMAELDADDLTELPVKASNGNGHGHLGGHGH